MERYGSRGELIGAKVEADRSEQRGRDEQDRDGDRNSQRQDNDHRQGQGQRQAERERESKVDRTETGRQRKWIKERENK